MKHLLYAIILMTCLAGCSNKFDVQTEVLEFKDPAVGKALANILDSANLEEFNDADAFYIKCLETPDTAWVESEDPNRPYDFVCNLKLETYHGEHGIPMDSVYGACKLGDKWYYATSPATVDRLFNKTGRTQQNTLWISKEECQCAENEIELNIDSENKITYRFFKIEIVDDDI